LRPTPSSPILSAVSKRKATIIAVDGECAGPSVCPLSRVEAGAVVCIKELAGSPEMCTRLREMGLGEQQTVRLVSRDSNIICQVCNARLGISKQLAETILVETIAA
jgi:ferrous iron transport protein A